MSYLDPTAVRLQLLANGYTPLPNVTKECRLNGWSSVEVDAELIRTRWSRMSAYTATGLRLMDGSIGAVDFDIQDKQSMDAIADRVFDRFPTWGDPGNPLLRRIGRPPKEMWLFRPRTPFKKMWSKEWVPAGVDTTDHAAVRDAKCQLELFGGLTGQIGAFGPHSLNRDGSVKHEYRWPDDDPLQIPAGQVPWLEDSAGNELCALVDSYFKERGWQQCMRSAQHGEGVLYTLNDGMVFRLPSGERITLRELEAQCQRDGERFMISPVPWLRDGSDSNSGVQVGRTRTGEVTLTDHMTGIVYMREATAALSHEDVAKKLSKLMELVK